MERLVTLGFTFDLVADFASFWTETSQKDLSATLVLGVLAASAALYRFVMPLTESDPAEFRVETIRR